MPRPTGRVLTLLELLQSGGTRTVAELADRLGVEGRTVRRYVDHLIDLDVPVESVRGRYGGYRLAPGYRLPPLMLSDDEALAVLLGLVAGRRAGLTTATRHGERDGGGQDPAGAARAPRPPARHPPGIPRLHGSSPASSPPRTPGSCSPSPMRCAIAGRSRSATPTATAGAANARCTRTGSSPIRAGGTSRARTPGSARTGPSGSIASRTRGPCPAHSRRPSGPDPAQRVLSGFATADVPA